MATTAERLAHLNTTKGLIKDTIVAKGVDVPASTPFRQYADKIAEIPQEGGGSDSGIRPAGRPALPFDGEPDDNNIYMLYGVGPNGVNDMSFSITATGGYKVDWGDDSSIEIIGSAVKCEHVYDYASLDVPPNAEGIKWVWIHFSANTSPFTVINHNNRPSTRSSASSSALYAPRVFEIYLKATQVTTWSFSSTVYTRYYNCELFHWYGENKVAGMGYMFYYWTALRSLILYTGNATSLGYFMRYCYSFNQPLDIDTSKAMTLTYFLSDCYAYAHPIIVDLRSATTAIGIGFIGQLNFSLPSLRLLNMGSVHSTLYIMNSSLSVKDLELLFGDLYDRTGITAGSIGITATPGASQLTDEQRAIATSKNWTITG